MPKFKKTKTFLERVNASDKLKGVAKSATFAEAFDALSTLLEHNLPESTEANNVLRRLDKYFDGVIRASARVKAKKEK